MHSESLNERMLNLVEDILLREVTTAGKKAGVIALVTHCRYRITWRVSLHSSTSLAEMWAGLRSLESVTVGDTVVQGVDHEVIISMVNEWVFRSKTIPGFSYSNFISGLVESLCWAAKSESMPESIVSFVGDSDAMGDMFEKNPWAVFLYLVGMTNAIKLVANHDPDGVT